MLRLLRTSVAALAALAGMAVLAPSAAAQQCTELPCGPLDWTPPVVTVTPVTGTYPAGTMSVQVDFTDNQLLDHESYSVLFNGQGVTSTFTYTQINGWTGRATGLVTLGAGSADLVAGICDAMYNCVTKTVTYTGPTPSVRVTPELTSLTVAVGTAAATRYRVVNTGAGLTPFTMLASCSGGWTDCAPSVPTVVLAGGDSAWVDVGFKTGPAGTGWVQLTAVSGSVSSFGGVTVSVVPSVETGYVGDASSLERIERSACVTVSVGPGAASECGDLRVAHALPSTRVLSKTRTPVLTYNSDHGRTQPMVAAHFSGPAGTPPDSIRAVLLVNGVQVAQQRWKGWGADQTRRIAISFDASNPTTYRTGLYPYTLQVTAEWLNGTQQQLPATRTGRMILVNRGASPFGTGWWLSGVEQLVTDMPGDTLKLWVGGDGSARLYRGPAGGPWRAAAYDRPDSLYKAYSGALGEQVYVRTLPGRSEVWFNLQGQHRRTINLLQKYTEFRWSGDYLQQIVMPYHSMAHDTVRYQFEYDNNPTAAVRNLSRVVAPGISTPRLTTLLTDTRGRITRITDPDSNFVGYAYSGTTGTMIQRTDRRLAWHKFSYLRGRFHTSTRQLTPNANAAIRVQAVQTLGMIGTSVRTDSVNVVFDGARPGAEVCDCVWWTVDRWGAPLSMRNTLGQVTTYRRGDARWPGLVTETVAPNGFVTTATYDSVGLPTSTTAWNPYGDTRNATTIFRYDAKWSKPLQVMAPEGEITRMDYDGYGRRAWEQVGPDATRRVNYAYHAETGLPETVTLPGGAVEQFGYDLRGNMSAVTDPLLVTTQILSDALGRPIRTLMPVQVGQQSLWQRDSTVYDVMDQVRETIATGPALNGAQQWLHVRNHYDDEGNLEEVERWSVPDAANVDTIRTRWEYDLAGRRIVEIAADSTPGTWADNPRDSTFYDPAGNVVRVRTRRYAESLAANPGDPAAAYIRMEYDALNRMYRRIIPAVRYPARHGGMVQRFHLGMAFRPYPYYPNDGSTGLLIPADTSLFEFNPTTGLMDHAVNGNARVRRGHFRNGQMSGDTLWTRTVAGGALDNTHRYGLEYRYDRNGRVTELRHPSQLMPPLAAGRGELGTRYGYDAVTGALKTVRDPMGNEFQYQYTLRGEPESLTLPGGITHLYTYNAGGQLQRHRIQNAATGGNRYASTMLRDETLGYDWRGKLVSARNLYGLRDTLTIAYTGLGQLAGSTHKYWGWYLDTNQSTSYLTTESPVHDALGNMVSINRTGALQVYGSGLLEAAQGRRNYTNGAFGYQPETGRLMERAEPSQFEFTTYDAAGNTVFTTAAPPGMQDGELLDRAAFYDGGGRLWATDVRRVESAIARMTPKYFTFEEYRLDALGRRVLVRARKHCDDVGDDRICSLSSVRRTIWAGDQELYEIQMPEAQGENDTGLVNGEPRYDGGFDSNPFWGRVAYTFGGGIDRPLSIVRMGYTNQHTQQGLVRWEEFAITPHWNAHGRAQSGTYHDGTRERCRSSYNDWFSYLNWCVQIQWADGMFPYNPAPNASESWHGSLLTEKRDASGLLYRRNRYYDPATGRFTQEDPIGLAGGVNVYGFANGDPVSYSDPMGLCGLCVIPVIVGILEAASTVYDIVQAGRTVSDANASGMDKGVAVAGVGAGLFLPGPGSMYSSGTRHTVDFASEALAFKHYAKHSRGVVLGPRGAATVKRGGADMPEFGSFAEYREAAQEFMSRPSGQGFLDGIRPKDGATVRFDPSTGYFGTMNNGVIKTFFRPDGNAAERMQYFLGQF